MSEQPILWFIFGIVTGVMANLLGWWAMCSFLLRKAIPKALAAKERDEQA